MFEFRKKKESSILFFQAYSNFCAAKKIEKKLLSKQVNTDLKLYLWFPYTYSGSYIPSQYTLTGVFILVPENLTRNRVKCYGCFQMLKVQITPLIINVLSWSDNLYVEMI